MKRKFFTIAFAGLLVCSMIWASDSLISSISDDDTKKEKEENVEAPVTKGKITVNKMEHDFGTITEDGGNVTATFILKNNMDEPILINKANASCGCTQPVWTKEPIAPGKTGEVKVTYKPQGRVYPFNKSVTILTSGDPERIVVRIKGIVEK